MIFVRDNLNFSIEEPTVLTIGKFDGLHMGHKKLLEFVAEKKKTGLKSVIFTFNIPPQKAIYHTDSKMITTLPEKELVFCNVGIDYFIECPFTEEIRNLEAEDFIRLTVEKFNVKCFVVGTDCHFGHNRSGDYEVLQQFADTYGYEVVVVEKKQYEGRDISSTFIREEIEKGNIEKANMLLGYPFFIMETVRGGNQLGRTIGFPTANLIPEDDKLLPPYGVYASHIAVGDKRYNGITNIGVKPTIEGNQVCGIETNIFDFHADIYGETIRVRLFSWLRPEQKFDSLEALQAQIATDCKRANNVLEAYS